MTIPSIANLRQSYERASLGENEVASDPLVQFDDWFRQALAAGVPEANSMTLATVGISGRPGARIVLLKDYSFESEPRGLVWFTNYESRKGQDLAVHPHASLLFFWPVQERQIRIEGIVSRVSAEESDQYFATRPRDSQIGAWASPQSEVLRSRDELTAREAEFAGRFKDEVPRPPHWGGYRLVPDYLEFWQGRASRLHDRISYRLEGDASWQIRRLAP